MGLFRRAETAGHDDARTCKLLDAADNAFDTDESAFVDVVMDGLMSDKATRPYPPAGHTYPKKG